MLSPVWCLMPDSKYSPNGLSFPLCVCIENSQVLYKGDKARNSKPISSIFGGIYVKTLTAFNQGICVMEYLARQ